MTTLTPGDRPWFAFYEPGVPRTVEFPTHPIYGFLDESARRYPGHAALVQVGPNFDRRITYRELDELTDRFAGALVERGVRPGDRVAIMLPNSPQYVVAAYGVWKAGGVVVQINPLYKGRDLAFNLKDSGARVAIGISRLYRELREVRPHTDLETVVLTNVHDFFPMKWRLLYGLARAKREGDVTPHEPGVVPFRAMLRGPRLERRGVASQDDPAVLQYTGGTTGIPKAATLSHRNLVCNCVQARSWLTDLKEGGERILSVVPFFHVFGLTICVNLSVAIAATNIVLLMRLFDVKTVVEAVPKYRPTVFPGVPAMYLAINQLREVERYDLKSIRACVSGSAPLPVEVQRRFEELTGGRITEGFGLSEASPLTHANPIYGRQKSGSIGIPVPSTDAKIVDLETGAKTLGPNEVGELAIRGPQVMQGYWNNPDESARTIRDGWLYTGDIARMDVDGFFFIEDRKKDMVNIGGFKVFPREIEEILYEHPGVKEAAVAGVHHRIRGELLVAHVVPRDGADARALTRELREYCAQRLASYKVPRRFEIVAEIPKTILGKALRRDIREREERRADAPEED
ncbi:MAG: long-chain fatty acid--CoA ligase [Armatimonadota bacterium]|nr:long-chain fatty acid--CoA ligase [Armatimonadota bacterium]